MVFVLPLFTLEFFQFEMLQPLIVGKDIFSLISSGNVSETLTLLLNLPPKLTAGSLFLVFFFLLEMSSAVSLFLRKLPAYIECTSSMDF